MGGDVSSLSVAKCGGCTSHGRSADVRVAPHPTWNKDLRGNGRHAVLSVRCTTKSQRCRYEDSS